MNVISFANGEPPYFDDGTEPEADQTPRLTTFINPTKKGMVPRPSKARKFLTSAFGLDVAARIEMPNGVQDLIGKRLIGRVYHKPDAKNPKVIRDRVDDFRPLRNRPTRKAAPKTDEEVKADATDLLAKAKEVFGEDATF